MKETMIKTVEPYDGEGIDNDDVEDGHIEGDDNVDGGGGGRVKHG